MINLVAGGMGVAMVPEPVGRLTRDGGVYKPLAGGAPVIPLGLMWRKGSHEPATQHFVELVPEVGRAGV
jgi:DNA-binding transcriptional LysR family regulator